MPRPYPTILVLLVLAVSSCVAGDEATTQLKKETAFASWPGKGGPLKKGLNFVPADYPALKGFVIDRDDYDLRGDFGLLRHLRLKRDSETILMWIGVAHSSTDNAHELLLPFLDVDAPLDLVFKRDKALGDVSFVSSSPIAEVAKRYACFARSNVMCEIADANRDGATTVDVPRLARDIDAKIQQQADLTPEQFDAKRPVIAEFAPAKPTLHRKKTDPTTLKITVTDPDGGSLRKIVTTSGDLEIDTGVDPPVAQAWGNAGAFTVELLAVNPFLQYQTATTTITVVDP